MTTGLITSRWTKLRPHTTQTSYYDSLHRFNVVPAGRRSGKTEIAKRRLIRRAMLGTSYDNARFFAAAPTHMQAKRIYWQDLKRMFPPWVIKGKPSESELVITLVTGTEVHVLGLDKPERIEGAPWDGGILDEYGNMKAGAWGANVRPALSDRGGWCDLIGVPEGRNHYYDLANEAAANFAADPGGDWAHFHWKSADILPAKEIEAARHDLDELTFLQEYEGSFVNFGGRAYYSFNAQRHAAHVLKYNNCAPIALCFDFNVEPGVCAVVQEQHLPGLPENATGTGVIGEVHIPRNSNTEAVCRKIIQDWGKHVGRVVCYGDATGGARGSARVSGSDWDIIRAQLRPVFGERLLINVPPANPPERSRINAMNSRLQSADGTIKLMVDARKAPHVVKDLEGVTLLQGGSGEIDKQKSPELSHVSDALGYYVVKEFPIAGRGMLQVEMGGV